MSTYQIQHRFSGAVLFEIELPAEIAAQSASRQLGYAIKEALNARAYLADAYLAGANLAGANLAGAYLAGANLAGANLAGANLADANLADANLAAPTSRAPTSRTPTSRAPTSRTPTSRTPTSRTPTSRAPTSRTPTSRTPTSRRLPRGANLAGADLAGAYLADANLADANLAGAYLAGARNVPETNGSESIQEPEPADRIERQRLRAERFRARNPDVPVIPDLDARILGIIDSGKGQLRMSSWHTCKTTHCRAGLAITLAGAAGAALEDKHGPHRAGMMIYRASTGGMPAFFRERPAGIGGIANRRRCKCNRERTARIGRTPALRPRRFRQPRLASRLPRDRSRRGLRRFPGRAPPCPAGGRMNDNLEAVGAYVAAILTLVMLRCAVMAILTSSGFSMTPTPNSPARSPPTTPARSGGELANASNG